MERRRIAFYAPLKAPDRGSLSGDRRIGQLLMRALLEAGYDVELAARLRSRESKGDVARQQRLRSAGERWAERLIRRYLRRPAVARPALWFTYHLYYKAPDWIGPAVTRALAIPYVVAEASHAPKRDREPWRMVHRAAAEAIGEADIIIALNSDDVGCLEQLVPAHRIAKLAPFIDIDAYRPRHTKEALRARLGGALGLHAARPWLVCVGMMRAGDKFASYRVLAAALLRLLGLDWQLLIIGDGPCREAVEDLFAPMAERVRFVGKVEPESVVQVLGACDLYVWPAVNEAFGLAFLEAQTAGLPVVSCQTRGVPDVVANGETGLLIPPDDARALALAVEELLKNDAKRMQMAAAGAHRCQRLHGIAPAARRLKTLLDPLFRRRD
ncbi:MAG: glycosyltransferase [Gammaproteobacteria bacterium]|nr:glycosyltransferase [Gammaproteobacteria bacterium]